MKAKNKVRVSSENVKKDKSKKLNPFEVHINRSKYQVLGRKLKSDRGLPGISKNKAIQKRKQTLLQEYKMKDKRNNFIDQRIGERNSSMTEDDRIMARFAAERMRMFNKKTKFNLSDTEVLTHKGQTLSEIERFEDIRSDDEEDEEMRGSGALKGKFVENAHFGGGMLTKSKQDRESLIDELINESKRRKAERQRNKEETLEATEQLDEEWKTLAMIVTTNKDKTDVDTQKKDQYDIVMRQLKFEPHGQPTQRLKTEEEIAKEDKEQLEKLERERLKQLREIEANKYGSHKSADDLDDGFSNLTEDFTENDLTAQNKESDSSSENESDNEVENGEGEGESGEEEEEEEKDNGEEDEEEENDEREEIKGKDCNADEPKSNTSKMETKKDHSEINDNNFQEMDVEDNEVGTDNSNDEESSDEECAMDDLADLMPSADKKTSSPAKKSTLSPPPKILKNEDIETDSSQPKMSIELDLPYVMALPENYESFKKLLSKYSSDQQNVIFDRLIKSNHPSLEPGNKKKMFILAEYIVQLVIEGEIKWKLLPVLVSKFTILKEFNKEECLKIVVDNFSKLVDDFKAEELPVHLVKYLVWYILLFLRPQGMDVLIPLNKPAVSLACRFISRTKNVSLGLLCCHLLLQDAKVSSTVYPEAISFLHSCLVNSLPSVTSSTSSDGSKTSQHTNDNQLIAKDKLSDDLRINLEESNAGDKEDIRVLHCSIILISDFVKAYRKYPQSKLMFKPTHNSLKMIKTIDFPLLLKEKIGELETLLQVLASATLPPLMKTAKKPKALRQYEPSFHTVTVGKSHRGLPAEKQEEQKLLHKYKHELKGAMRELRRDHVFLANIKLKEKALSDEQRKRKVKEIFSSAAIQQGELRSLKRKK